MKQFYYLIALLIFIGLPTGSHAQATIGEDENGKPKNWHFAVNIGTHYLQSHYNKGFYYNGNPRETLKEKFDIEFRNTFGLWVGGNINYRTSENWYISFEVALQTIHSGYRVDYKMPHHLVYREESSKKTLLTTKPFSATRVFNINNKWQVPVNVGVHLSFNLLSKYNLRQAYNSNTPDIVRDDESKWFRVRGGGLALEAGITRKLSNGELSLLFIPTPRNIYFTNNYSFYSDIFVASSGAIVKVQYAFK